MLVRDGNSKEAPLIGDRLCGRSVPQPVIGSGDELYLEFHSDSRNAESGFKLIVKEV